jgi:hypothetical protein
MRAKEFLKENNQLPVDPAVHQAQRAITTHVNKINSVPELNKIYSFIRKVDLGDGFKEVFSKDKDLVQVQSILSQAIIDVNAPIEEKLAFAKEFATIGVIDANLLLTSGVTRPIDSAIVTDYPNIYQQVAPALLNIAGQFHAGEKKTKKGKGEFFFALCSPDITLSKNKGDLMINRSVAVEVKDNEARLISRNGYGTTVQATAEVAKDIEDFISEVFKENNPFLNQPQTANLGPKSNFWSAFGPTAIQAGVNPNTVVSFMKTSMKKIVSGLYTKISSSDLQAFTNSVTSNGTLDWKAFTSVAKPFAFRYYKEQDQFSGILFINSDKQTFTYIDNETDFATKIGVKGWGFYPSNQNAGLQVKTP